jgi:predicted O-methyltransferase YrrM
MSHSTKQPSRAADVVNTIAVEHTDCCIVDEARTTHSESTQAATPAEDLRRLVLGYRVSQAISVVAELGIADLLASGPRTADDLAAVAGAHGPSLYRVLRLLASEGVFAETEDGRFELTPMAGVLRREGPGPVRALALQIARDAVWRSWGSLLHAVRTGETAFEHVHGVDFFAYYRQHPQERIVFDQLMAALTASTVRAVAVAYDFSGVGTVVDVGGGRGALAIGLLDAYAHLRGIVFDQPVVAADARQAIARAGLADRCEAVGGDFFAAVPPGGDAYLLKFILHDWDDERCVSILRTCRRAMPRTGRLLVVELLVPRGTAPSFAKSQDVNMLVNSLGGQERTEAEYRALFAAAGFDLTETTSAQGELHIIEGVPI